MAVPLYIGGVSRKPCFSVCERVETRCPHLHPAHGIHGAQGGGGQYAGEPVFLCIGELYYNNPYLYLLYTSLVHVLGARSCAVMCREWPQGERLDAT